MDIALRCISENGTNLKSENMKIQENNSEMTGAGIARDKEYVVGWDGVNGSKMTGYFYGKDAYEAKQNAIRSHVSAHRIQYVRYKEDYRGYGHL